MITRKVATALAAGATCVVKADAETPYSALALAEIIKRAGVPDGVVNVIPAKAALAEIGKELCENPKVRCYWLQAYSESDVKFHRTDQEGHFHWLVRRSVKVVHSA